MSKKKLKIEVGKKYWLYGEYEVQIVDVHDKKQGLFTIKFLTEEGKKYFHGELLIVPDYNLLDVHEPNSVTIDYPLHD